MSDGRLWVFAKAEVGTHHAFVNLLARVTWALKDVALYRLWVRSIPAGVELELEGHVPEGDVEAVLDAVREAGMRLPTIDGVSA